MKIRTYHELEGSTSDLGEQVGRQEARVAERLEGIRRVIGVMSGKGGVGKSLLAALLAEALVRRGVSAGLLDADVQGPSAARMLGLDPGPLAVHDDGVEPARSASGIVAMSMSLLVEDDASIAWNEPESASFVWRGVQERGVLREFLADVRWGRLDMLIVDLPPGTGRIVELHELVPGLAGLLAVTIPSAASRDAVARSIQLARARDLPLLGLVENLAGYRCDECGAVRPMHAGGGGDELSRRFGVPVRGRFPFDPALDRAADAGALDAWLADDASGRAEAVELADALLGEVGLRDPEDEGTDS